MARPGAGRLPRVAPERLSVRPIQQLRKRLWEWKWPVQPVRFLRPGTEPGFQPAKPRRGLLCIGRRDRGPVEYAAPATVVAPGATVTPSYQSGSSTTPSVGTAPLPPETPSELDRVEPLPKSKIVTPPTSGSSASSSLPGSKTSYQTRRQDPGSRLARRPRDLAPNDGLDA